MSSIMNNTQGPTTNNRPVSPLTPNKTQNFNRDDIFRKLKRYSKYLEKHVNNYIPYDSEQNIPTKGFYIKISNISGLKKDYDLKNSKDKRYFVKFFLTFFEEFPKKFFGNTYKSGNIPIKTMNDFYFDISSPEFIYFVSNLDSKAGLYAVIEIVFAIENIEKGSFEYESEGWSLLKINYNFPDDMKNLKSNIFKGTPRSLLFKNKQSLSVREGTAIVYDLSYYTELEPISHLIPKFCFLGSNDLIPGLEIKNLPSSPLINSHFKLLPTEDVYLKNVEITFPEELENKMLLLANQYRKQKFDIDNDSALRPVSIQNRRFKCGLNNVWVFVNKTGLENSVNLNRIDRSILSFKGVLPIDNYFRDNMLAFIFELQFSIILPLPYNKEEALNLTSCYCICIPEVVDKENRFFSYIMMDGPGFTIYGEKLFDIQSNEQDKLIVKLNFILSTNKDYTEQSSNQKELQEMQRKINKLNSTNQLAKNELNKTVKKKEEELERQFELKKNELEREFLEKTKAIQEQNSAPKTPDKEKTTQNVVVRETIITAKPKELELIKNDGISETNPMDLAANERELAKTQIHKIKSIENEKEKEIFSSTVVVKEKEAKVLYESRYKLDNQVDLTTKNVEQSLPKVVYEPGGREISKKDKAELINKGVEILQNQEFSNNLSDFYFDSMLSDENKGLNILFNFIAFKPKSSKNDYSSVPDKIFMKFTFWNYEDTMITDVAQVNKPNDDTIQYSSIPLVLTKETSLLNTHIDDKEVKIEILYDPSSDPYTDFKDFIEYLVFKSIYIEVYDAEKNFLIGFIKLNLKEYLADKKSLQMKAKEFDIYDNNFDIQGSLQMIVKVKSVRTERPFDYDFKFLRFVDSREKNLQFNKKKKIYCKPINVNNISEVEKENLAKTLISSEKLDIKSPPQEEPKIKLLIDPDTQKKLRAMKYSKNPQAIKFPQNKIEEIKQKQEVVGEFYKNLTYVQKIREFKKEETISKAINSNSRNTLSVSLVLGRPHLFNLAIFNPYDTEELFQIILGEKSNEENKNNDPNNLPVRVVSDPDEWSFYCANYGFVKPSDYNIISSKNVFVIGPGETIPLLFKILSYDMRLTDTNYMVWIYRTNGQPQYCLNLLVKEVFQLIDHSFRYYVPEYKIENINLPNPFKYDKLKTNNFLENYYSTDKSVILSLDKKSNNFVFKYKSPSEGNVIEFNLIFYSDKYCSNIEFNWKIVIQVVQIIDLTVKLGSKSIHKIPIEDSSARTVRLYSSNNEVVFVPSQNEKHIILIPNVQNTVKLCVFPKKEENYEVLLNLTDISNRELLKSWLMRIKPDIPKYENVQNIECKLFQTTHIKFDYKNSLNSWVIYNFESNSNFLQVIDTRVPFNAYEKKTISLCVPAQNQSGRAEVCLFVSDVEEFFSDPILFKLNFIK